MDENKKPTKTPVVEKVTTISGKRVDINKCRKRANSYYEIGVDIFQIDNFWHLASDLVEDNFTPGAKGIINKKFVTLCE